MELAFLLLLMFGLPALNSKGDKSLILIKNVVIWFLLILLCV